jgi:hypothetical protein
MPDYLDFPFSVGERKLMTHFVASLAKFPFR